jgi:hypothetical protein
MSRSYSPAEMSALRDPLLEPRPGQHAAAATPNAGTRQRLQHGQSASPDETPEEQKTEARDVEPRKQYEHRGRAYMLRSSEIQAMTDIGKFRAVAAKDLEGFVYRGDRRHIEADLSNLHKQRLILEREETSYRRLLALTKEGYRLLVATKSTQKEQVLYHGFTKPREAHYDADLYRLYQKDLERIAREEGKNIRVILDSEFKRNLYRDLATVGRTTNSSDTKAMLLRGMDSVSLAAQFPCPTFASSTGPLNTNSLGLTSDLRRKIVQKIRAGFAIYALAGRTPSRRVLEQREITAEILDL